MYNSHFRAYEVKSLKCSKTVPVTELFSSRPLHVRTVSALPGCVTVLFYFIILTKSNFYTNLFDTFTCIRTHAIII